MTLSESYNLLTQVSIFSVIVPLITAIFKRKTLNLSLRVLCLYLLVCLASDILCLTDNKAFQNKVLNLFTILEYLLFIVLYYIESKTKKFKVCLVLISIMFLIICLWQFTIKSKFVDTDIFVSTLEAFILVVFSASFLFAFVDDPNLFDLMGYYLYWIVMSNLAYFSSALIFFIFGDFIQNAPFKTSTMLWGLHDLINIVCYILFSIGIWKAQRK